jgi:hypothetical protein
MDTVEQVAAAVLYEGYVLWPYRRSARKNRKRWTRGDVYPRAFSEAVNGSDPWRMQTQYLVTGAEPVTTVKVRFLHVIERRSPGAPRVEPWRSSRSCGSAANGTWPGRRQPSATSASPACGFRN